VPDVHVTLRYRQGGAIWRQTQTPAARTDAGGSFLFSDLLCGAYSVTASTGNRATAQPARVEVTQDAPGANIRIVLSAHGHTITGIVTDRSAGVISGATVRAASLLGHGAYTAVTDEQGRYALHLSPGNYLIEASAIDYAPVWRRLAVSRDRQADFSLDPAGTIRGRVILAQNGEPVPGAAVRATRGWQRWRPAATALSEGDGSFEITGLAAGEYDVEASRGRLRGQYPGHVPVNVASYVPNVLIRVETGLSIFGVVTDEEEHAIVGATVQWWQWGGQGPETRSESDGSFLLTGLTPGRGRVVARHPHYAPGQTEVALTDIDVEVEIVLARGVRIEGLVANQNGTPVPGAIVTASPSGRGGRMFRRMRQSGANDVTDEDGRFVLDGLDACELTIRAQHSEAGLAKATLADLVPGNTYEVSLVMAQGALVTGRVSWSDGTPADSATVHAFSRGMGSIGQRETVTDEAGAYTLTGLEGRTYHLWAMRPGDSSVMPFPTPDAPQLEITLEPAQEMHEVDFVLVPADQQITGKVIDEAGAPVADAEVGADPTVSSLFPGRMRARLMASAATRSGADGGFGLDELPAGTYDVWAELPGFPRGSAEGIETETTGVVITIPPGATLSGVVHGADQAPATSFVLRTLPDDGSTGWLRWRGADRLDVNDPTGSFTVSGLRAGTYRLVATTPAGLVGELAAVEVAVGERKDGLQINVTGGATLKGSLSAHPSNAPVAHADLFLVTDASRQPLTTKADGTFFVEGLVTGEAALMVRPDSALYVPDRFGVHFSHGENTIALRIVELTALLEGNANVPLQVSQDADRFIVVITVPQSAGKAQTGDALVAIDGNSVVGLGIRGVKALLRGPSQSIVELSLVSANTGEAYTTAVTRGDEPVGQ